MSLRRKTYVLLAARVCFNAFGDVSLKRGMNSVGDVSFSSLGVIWLGFLHIISNGTIWLGIGFMLAFFFCHLLLFSWADYSYVMPTTAANYVVVPLLGLFLLHETVGFTMWIGIAIISVGVILVGWTEPHARKAT